jgi:hypothetical protein
MMQQDREEMQESALAGGAGTVAGGCLWCDTVLLLVV